MADADFDGLVDGQEFADLDGDGTIDQGHTAPTRTTPTPTATSATTVWNSTAGTNPLIEDFMVTVFFNGLTITDDGDWEPGDHNGDFAFDFGVRLPGGGSRPRDFKSVVHDTVLLTDPFDYDLALTDQQVEPHLPNDRSNKWSGVADKQPELQRDRV